jgi:hypothetical protein
MSGAGIVGRMAPIFVKNIWKSVYLFTIQQYTLVVLAPCTLKHQILLPCIEKFGITFLQSRLDIPSEVRFSQLWMFSQSK